MSENDWPLAGKRVGILGRGGCGKSTLTALLAQGLAHRGHRVCVLDADSTNVGLFMALGLEKSPAPLIDHFGGMVFSGGRVTCPVDDPRPLRGARISLRDLPSQFFSQTPEGIIYLTVGKMGHRGAGGGCDGPLGKIARDFRLELDDEPLVTLIDFKAGFEDTARGIITGLDMALVVVDPTGPAVEMAVDMKTMVEQIRAGELPATDHLDNPELVEAARQSFHRARILSLSYVLNKVRNNEIEHYLRDRLSDWGITPLAVIREDPGISVSWLRGRPLVNRGAESEIASIIGGLEASASSPGAGAMPLRG
ncbi:P-loop NTPase [Candidatus Sumerlaeota bacterium]|nr:P-loop NTPase [Candidatus Sumerlaeota bacterium]